MSTAINDRKFCGKSHKRGLKFGLRMVKFVIYPVIEIIIKANVRNKDDKL